jgi:hypothetical protein
MYLVAKFFPYLFGEFTVWHFAFNCISHMLQRRRENILTSLLCMRQWSRYWPVEYVILWNARLWWCYMILFFNGTCYIPYYTMHHYVENVHTFHDWNGTFLPYLFTERGVKSDWHLLTLTVCIYVLHVLTCITLLFFDTCIRWVLTFLESMVIFWPEDLVVVLRSCLLL